MRRISLDRHRAVLSVALLLTLAILVFPLVWPRVSATLFDWIGEEEPLEQVKGLGALLEIWLFGPRLDLAPNVPVNHVPGNPFGVNTFLQLEADPANVDRSLAMVKAAGFAWIRQQFPWEDIEIHGKGDYQDRRTLPFKSAWLKYDRIVDLVEKHGLNMVVRLDAPPQWSRSNPAEEGTFGPPDNLADYADFVEAVVRRYRGRIHTLQIWNEPNIYPEWGNKRPDPERYVEMLQLATTRARAVDPNIVIISAPLAPTLDDDARSLNDLKYLERMYLAGARGTFDILGAIAYGLGTAPTDHRVAWNRTNFARPELLRDLMVRYGDADKPVWIMEMGWNAVPEGMPAPFGRVTEAQQARYSVLAFERIRNEWPWAGVGFLWHFRLPDDSRRDQPIYYFRLVDPDWTPRPVYSAIQAVATRPQTP